ncbi:MAG: cytochrome c family protein [Leptothrix sp. (in: b-proteobacteria)]
MSRRALAIAATLGLALLSTARSATPDPIRGEQVYARCLACHALAYDRVGPRHCGLFGRRAGSVPGFAYSAAMQQSQLTWDDQTLERFLAAPMQAMPGTAMTYDGVPDRQERADLIAYLRQVGQSDACLQQPARR